MGSEEVAKRAKPPVPDFRCPEDRDESRWKAESPMIKNVPQANRITTARLRDRLRVVLRSASEARESCLAEVFWAIRFKAAWVQDSPATRSSAPAAKNGPAALDPEVISSIMAASAATAAIMIELHRLIVPGNSGGFDSSDPVSKARTGFFT